MKKIYTLILAIFCGQFLIAQELTLKPLGVFTAGAGDEATEILTYDASTNSIFVVNSDLNSIQRIDISNPDQPNLLNTFSLDAYGASANSVDVSNGTVAVAVENADALMPGSVVFFDLEGNYLNQVEAGVLPDMLTFNKAGTKVIVANEGEPNDEYNNDPEGSISIVDVSNGIENATATRLRLNIFGDKAEVLEQGIRIFGPGASVAQDLEPEYITVAPSDEMAFVVCQENNAVITVDIVNDTITGIFALGYKDYSLMENAIDASDKNSDIVIKPWDNVLGMYQPDGMASYSVNGTTYIVTANEGDARDYDGYSEEVRVDDLVLDPDIFMDATLQNEENLGRLKTTTAFGDTDGDGDHDIIYSYGARSFSIFDADGNLVFDSGNDFVTRLQDLVGEDYVKNRSDDKGSEPESVTLGTINDRILAFIGLERQNGFFIYDITDPTNVSYAGYGQRDGDIGPESSAFVGAAESPNGKDLLITANEVSGTVTVFEVVEGKFGESNPVKIFDEELTIDDYVPQEVVMPPSPLTTQVVFVGGYDIVQTTPTYGNPAGRAVAKEWHDFIGFTPDTTGGSLGWVSVNHEMIYKDDYIGDGGGMTVFQVGEGGDGIEVLEQTLSDGRQGHYFNVDFVNTVGETGMNCAGISAPNGRIWTAEEWFRSSMSSIHTGNVSSSSLPIRVAGKRQGFGVRDTADFTINTPEFPLVDGKVVKKYENFNYMVEIDPKEAVAVRKQYNWGRAGWEGGAITADGKYAYLGIDGSPAPWVRVTAATPWEFTDVTLEVYKQDNDQGERWIEIDMTNEDNIFGGLVDAAWSVGATMFMRNEWVAIDQETGMVYWTETGRDGSSGAGIRFIRESNDFPVAPAAHHNQIAEDWYGLSSPIDSSYNDYYGRVLYYDPATEEVGVVVNGGPYFADSPAEENYPNKHLSNPDGLNIITIDERNFLMIQEDLNGSSFGRSPEGISNRLCELYLLPVEAKDADVEELIRVTAIPEGAEITGAIQISDNTILVNSQHPNVNNPFPYNHSLTMAIHGWADLEVSELTGGQKGGTSETVRINKTTREFSLPYVSDIAIYNDEYQRIKVERNTNQINVGAMDNGVYYVVTGNDEVYKLIIE